MGAAWNDRECDDCGEQDGSLVEDEREYVGVIASPTIGGAIRVDASRGAVTLARRGEVLGLSPALARSLSGLLARAADVAECVCVVSVGERVRNPACLVHRRGRQ